MMGMMEAAAAGAPQGQAARRYPYGAILAFLSAVAVAVFTHKAVSPPPPVARKDFVRRYGRVALITGAGQGVGAEFAEQLAAMGFDLVLVSRTAETLRPRAEGIEGRYGVKVTQIVAELGVKGAEQKVVKQAAGLGVSLYVGNHAGTGVLARDGGVRRHWVDEPLESHISQAETTYLSHIRLCHHFARQFASMNRGGIILVSSTASSKASPFLATYASSKAALANLGVTLWYELRPLNVDVVVGLLGVTDTPSLRAAATEKGFKRLPVQKPSSVVEEVLRGLGRRPIVIPGFFNKASELLLALMPPGVVGRAAEGVMVQNFRVEAPNVTKDGGGLEAGKGG